MERAFLLMVVVGLNPYQELQLLSGIVIHGFVIQMKRLNMIMKSVRLLIGCHFLLAPPENDVILDAMKIRGQTVYPLKERLDRLSKAMPSGCIEWQSTIRNGYGRLIIGSRTDGSRKSVSAHRLAYEVYVGEIPDGMFVCHTCDNPKCINHEHLFVGTRQDNVDDRENKQRNKMPPVAKNEQAYFVKYTDDIINKIRQETGPSRLAAAKYGVSERYVRDIRNNKYRKLPEPPK